MGKSKAVFFDRDGVLIKDRGILTSWSQVELVDGASDVLHSIKSLGYKAIVVTNQAVVARGLLTLEEAEALNHRILSSVGEFDGAYICPHHPNANVKSYRVDCSCRKPKSGMLIQARDEHNIDLSRSYLIGDRLTDIAAGNLAGVKTIHLFSERSSDPLIEFSDRENFDETIFDPFAQIKNLNELYDLIRQGEQK